MTKPQPKTTAPPPRKSGWTSERRVKHAAAIRRWQPWKNSTGPKTAAGKARAAQNAAKPWLRRDPGRVLGRAMRAHRRYLSEINRYLAARKFFRENELLKKRRRALLKMGRAVTSQLITALAYAKLCKNLDLSTHLRVKMNANEN